MCLSQGPLGELTTSFLQTLPARILEVKFLKREPWFLVILCDLIWGGTFLAGQWVVCSQNRIQPQCFR